MNSNKNKLNNKKTMVKCKTNPLSFFTFYFNSLTLLLFISILLTFKFIQLRFFYQLLLSVVINFSIL